MNFKNDPSTRTDDIGFLLSLPIWLAVFGGGIAIAFLAYGQASAAKDIALLSMGAAGGATVTGSRRGGNQPSVNVNADRSYVPVDVDGGEEMPVKREVPRDRFYPIMTEVGEDDLP